MREILLIALLLFSACSSKPTARSSAAKATPQVVSANSVELATVVAYAPRRAEEMEQVIILAEPVQVCLRAAPEVRDIKFTLGLEGYLNYKGVIESLQVITPAEPLKACLSKEIQALAFGRGKMGPFKMQVIRAQSTENKHKGLFLDLSRGKKFE